MTTFLIPGLIPGCAPPPTGFESAAPAERARAIAEAVRNDDRSPETLRRLVEQLDAADPTVRMLAIDGLDRLTGTRRGFVYDAPRAERDAAVQRWVRALDHDEARARDARHGVTAAGVDHG